MKNIHLLGFVFCLVITSILSASGGILPGYGTESSPYLIEDLSDFDHLVSNYGQYDGEQYLKLTTDLDLAGKTYTNYVFPGLAGVFLGDGHTIHNLTINTDDSAVSRVGFIGQINNANAAVKGLNLVNVSINDNHGSENVGGLCGRNYGGRISNCTVSGSVNGYMNVGLLVGYNDNGTISDCGTSGTVSGFKWVGGLAGCQDGSSGAGGNIFASCSTASVTGSINVGGLIGENHNRGYVLNSYASGDITGQDSSAGLYCIGGFCGYNGGRIGYSYSSGLISVDSSDSQSIGGFCGYSADNLTGVEPIENCFWDTDTSQTTYPGDNVTGATGLPTAQMQTKSTFIHADWSFADYPTDDPDLPWIMVDYPKLSWQDVEYETVPELIGMTQAEAENSIIEAGFVVGDIKYEFSNSVSKDRVISQAPVAGTEFSAGGPIDIIISYGVFPLSGTGTVDDPYLICSINDFDAFTNEEYAKYFWDEGLYTKLMCDIDLDINLPGRKVYVDSPIASKPFGSKYIHDNAYRGIFNGNGYSICNMQIKTCDTQQEFTGLFGRIYGENASISNLQIVNADIDGCKYSGILAGAVYYSDIDNCSSSGNVNGSSYIGGMVGCMREGSLLRCVSNCVVESSDEASFVGGLCGCCDSAIIGDCYSEGIVISGEDSNYVGGICGYSGGAYKTIIKKCYSNSTIIAGNSSSFIGGLCGLNGRNINSCYATGKINILDNTSKIGGLCGENSGLIEKCYSDANIMVLDISKYIGGLCGYNDYGGALDNCYSLTSVSGTSNTDYVGGFCGYNKAKIYCCYSLGKISGNNYIGGFIGVNNSETLFNNLWNIETADTTIGIGNFISGLGGVVGKTTIEMNQIETYILSDWSFVYHNNAPPKWYQIHNSYPKFLWQKHVNLEDFAVLSQYWLQQDSANCTRCGTVDYCFDGKIDIIDFNQLACCWLEEPQYYCGAIEYIQDFSYGIPIPDWNFSLDRFSNTRVVDGKLRMSSYSRYNYCLNEAVIHIDLTSKENIMLSFWHKSHGDSNDGIPATYNGSYYGDGVSISGDGENWIRVFDATELGMGTKVFNLDSLGVVYTKDFQIKFQQYGNDIWTNYQGREWDDIMIYEKSQ